jgi:hypothetical protein
MLYLVLNQNVTIALADSNPFKAHGDRRIELFNEAMLMTTGYHLFLFTEFVPNAETRYFLGFSLMASTLLNLSVNLLYVLSSPVLKFIRKVKSLHRRSAYRHR